MASFDGATSLKENVQASSATAVQYYTSYAGGVSNLIARLVPTPDTTDPVVTIVEPQPGVATVFYPAPGVSMLPDEALIFEVTDPSGFSAIIPMVILDPFAAPEVASRGVIDGEFAFEALYSLRSTRTVIPNGYRYMLLRRGGWEVNPRFYILVVDSAGNVTIAP